MGKPIHYLVLFTVIFVAFISSVMFHDNGIPKSITEADKARVVATIEKADAQFDNVLKKTRQFVERPDSESETCPQLAKAIYKWRDTLEVIGNEPIFFYPDPDSVEAGRKLVARIENELETETSKLIDEVIRRREEGCDNQEFYDLISKEIDREITVLDSAPCTPTECRWCRSKYAMVNYLLNKVRQ